MTQYNIPPSLNHEDRLASRTLNRLGNEISAVSRGEPLPWFYKSLKEMHGRGDYLQRELRNRQYPGSR